MGKQNKTKKGAGITERTCSTTSATGEESNEQNLKDEDKEWNEDGESRGNKKELMRKAKERKEEKTYSRANLQRDNIGRVRHGLVGKHQNACDRKTKRVER